MVAHPRRPLMSVEEYLELDRTSLDTRYEYQEYVLVSTLEQAIDLYRRQTEKLWTFHPFGPDDMVELKSLNIRFPIAEVYENLIFPESTA